MSATVVTKGNVAQSELSDFERGKLYKELLENVCKTQTSFATEVQQLMGRQYMSQDLGEITTLWKTLPREIYSPLIDLLFGTANRFRSTVRNAGKTYLETDDLLCTEVLEKCWAEFPDAVPWQNDKELIKAKLLAGGTVNSLNLVVKKRRSLLGWGKWQGHHHIAENSKKKLTPKHKEPIKPHIADTLMAAILAILAPVKRAELCECKLLRSAKDIGFARTSLEARKTLLRALDILFFCCVQFQVIKMLTLVPPPADQWIFCRRSAELLRESNSALVEHTDMLAEIGMPEPLKEMEGTFVFAKPPTPNLFSTKIKDNNKKLPGRKY